MGPIVVTYVCVVAAMITAGWFWLKDQYWPVMTTKLVDFNPPGFFAQGVAIAALALLCVYMSASFARAWKEMQRETTWVGQAGSFLVMVLPLLSGLFLIAGPIVEGVEVWRPLYVWYAIVLYALAIVSVLMIVHDDIVAEAQMNAFARKWAWHKTSIVLFPYALVAYVISPLGSLKWLFVGAVVTWAFTWLIVISYKQLTAPTKKLL